jgi:Holliday junction DNA helicase RuvA
MAKRMIGRIRGALIYRSESEVIIEAGGVGYTLQISAATRDRLPVLDDELSLWVTTRFRDDQIFLYGFLERREQTMFLRLLKVNGVGPKLAFTIISGASIDQLERQLVNREAKELAKLPGVGKKLSQRLVLELGEFLKKELGELELADLCGGSNSVESGKNDVGRELMAALAALGYRESEVATTVAGILKKYPDQALEVLLKLALQEFHRG